MYEDINRLLKKKVGIGRKEASLEGLYCHFLLQKNGLERKINKTSKENLLAILMRKNYNEF